MKSFGRKANGLRQGEYERRRSGRTSISVSGSLDTPAMRRSVALVDVSPTGAHVRASDLPKTGNFVKLDVERTTIFGTVIWSRGDQCGLQFDELLARDELDVLKRAHLEARDLEMESWPDQVLKDLAQKAG